MITTVLLFLTPYIGAFVMFKYSVLHDTDNFSDHDRDHDHDHDHVLNYNWKWLDESAKRESMLKVSSMLMILCSVALFN